MAVAIACSKPPDAADLSPPAADPPEDADPALPPASRATPYPARATASCGAGRRMTVHFYDVGEGLSALVDLPDGRHLLVDTGEGAHRSGCGAPCTAADRHLIERLHSDLGAAPLDLLWITHQHADHIGGAPEVLETLHAGAYVDNGRDRNKPYVRRAHGAADSRATARFVVDPEHTDMPIASSRDLKLRPIVPYAWPSSCSHDPNECSIALRIDFCSSSLLFTGDAEHDEEATLDPLGSVTLLQVAHHGSETSTTPGFLAKSRPKYAVISAGKRGEGHNRSFCHPRARIVQRLTKVLGGSANRSLDAFDGDRCDRSNPADWVAVATSEFLWATERDGDVVLTTTGDGTFYREGQ